MYFLPEPHGQGSFLLIFFPLYFGSILLVSRDSFSWGGSWTTFKLIKIVTKSIFNLFNKFIFIGNNNEQDILNTQLAVLNKLVQVLRGGTLHQDLYQLDGSPSFEPFYDRFEAEVGGWALTFDVIIPNDISIC